MNILEAFEKSDRIRREPWDKGVFVDKRDHRLIDVLNVCFDDWEPVIEPLTFERIKRECEPCKTLLVDQHGKDRLYLGFDRKNESLITDGFYRRGSCEWGRSSLEGWQISSEKWEG